MLKADRRTGRGLRSRARISIAVFITPSGALDEYRQQVKKHPMGHGSTMAPASRSADDCRALKLRSERLKAAFSNPEIIDRFWSSADLVLARPGYTLLRDFA
jgi:hypothetical protein